MNKQGSFIWIFVAIALSAIIGILWDKIPIIKNTGHLILDPTLGAMLNWNVLYGMLIVIFLITFITTIIQKYATDQKLIKEMKAEQKKIQTEMKQHKDNPQKMMEFNTKQLELFKSMMPMTMRPVIYTAIPIVLFFRWFYDYFNAIGNPKFFGFLTWFWLYLIVSLVLSLILRKALKVE